MPGEDRLVAQLGVGRDTIKMALRSLEKEGLLVGQGVGRRRKIVQSESGFETPALRVAILDYEPPEHTEHGVLRCDNNYLTKDTTPSLRGNAYSNSGWTYAASPAW